MRIRQQQHETGEAITFDRIGLAATLVFTLVVCKPDSANQLILNPYTPNP